MMTTGKPLSVAMMTITFFVDMNIDIDFVSFFRFFCEVDIYTHIPYERSAYFCVQRILLFNLHIRMQCLYIKHV